MWDLDHKGGWTLKNWCFWTMVLEKTLESPIDCKRSHQWILKEISLELSLEGLMLKLKLQCFGHLIWRADSLEKTLMLGKIEDKRRRVKQRMRWLDSILDSMHMSLSKLWKVLKDREAWHTAVDAVEKSWIQLINWTTMWHIYCGFPRHPNPQIYSSWLSFYVAQKDTGKTVHPNSDTRR